MLQLGGGINDPQVYIGFCAGDKIPKPIGLPMFSRVSFSTVLMLTLFGDSFTPKFKMAPENRK